MATRFVSIIKSTNEESVGVIRFHEDGKRVYLDTNIGEENDLSRLTLFNIETGEEKLVESDPKKEVDFGGTVFSNVTKKLLATYYVGDRMRIEFHDKDFEKAYKKLKKQLPDGDIYLGATTNDDRYWFVTSRATSIPAPPISTTWRRAKSNCSTGPGRTCRPNTSPR